MMDKLIVISQALFLALAAYVVVKGVYYFFDNIINGK